VNYHIVSLGCPKNLVDSEIMMNRLATHGYSRVREARAADVIIVNTCAFIRAAKEESIDTVLELARHKEDGECKLLVVTGCLSQRYRAELPKEMPEVDVWIGTDEFPRIPEILNRSLKGEQLQAFTEQRIDYEQVLERTLATPKHWAYLKISEGCNHTCKFCIIPAIRGKFRSRSMESILEEARGLAACGVKELVLIAQDITDYGRDHYRRRALGELLERLSEIEGIEWLRIMYAYPTSVDQSLIDAMARNPKICKYLDIPLQHAAGNVLRAMSRPGDSAFYGELIGRFRAAVPEIAIRTTFIVGYPGETQADFEHLMSFMEQTRFDRVGVFTYSREEDTPAALLPGQVPDREKKKRFRAAYRLQQKISHEVNASRVGRELRVLVDEPIPGSEQPPSGLAGPDAEAGIGRGVLKFPIGARYLGRTEWDAPEIDGTVFISGEATPGTFCTVRITGAHPYDLVGGVVTGAPALS